MINKLEKEFLRESNAIERVYDDDSLRYAEMAWEYLKKIDELTPYDILQSHKLLMMNQNIQVVDKGAFRKCEVRIGYRNGEPWELVPGLIDTWCKATMEGGMIHFGEKVPFDPQALHVWYEEIHPFVDGNGRTGRMFMNWTRLKLTKEPLLVIHEGEEQMEYYQWFR